MKIKSNIDLGVAFDVLKAGLAKAEENRMDKVNRSTERRYIMSYSILAGFVEAHISRCTEKEDNKEGETLPERDANDIPDSMFRQ